MARAREADIGPTSPRVAGGATRRYRVATDKKREVRDPGRGGEVARRGAPRGGTPPMEGRKPSAHDPEEMLTAFKKFTLPVAMDERETVIIPAAGRRSGAAAGRTPAGEGEARGQGRGRGWRRHALPVGLSLMLALLTLSGAAIFVSA